MTPANTPVAAETREVRQFGAVRKSLVFLATIAIVSMGLVLLSALAPDSCAIRSCDTLISMALFVFPACGALVGGALMALMRPRRRLIAYPTVAVSVILPMAIFIGLGLGFDAMVWFLIGSFFTFLPAALILVAASAGITASIAARRRRAREAVPPESEVSVVTDLSP